MISSHFSSSTDCETFVPLWNRQQEWNYRLNIIRNAKKFIYTSTFYIDIKTYGEIFIDELITARKRKVKVILIIDSFGQKLGMHCMIESERILLSNKLQLLKELGVQIIYYQPKTSLQKIFGSGHHVKIQINDTGEALLGSSNISIRSFEQWNEFSCYVMGNIIIQLFDTLKYLLNDMTHEFSKDRDILLQTVKNKKRIHTFDYFFCDPNSKKSLFHPLFNMSENCITNRLMRLIDSAKHSIQLTSFYFKPYPKLLKSLILAVKRKVAITIFHSHRNALPETDLAWLASFQNYSLLLKNNITIFENIQGEHSKLLLIDNEIAGFGSYNFEYPAHDRLAEIFIITKDCSILNSIKNIFENLYNDKNNILVEKCNRSDLHVSLRLKSFIPLLYKWA